MDCGLQKYMFQTKSDMSEDKNMVKSMNININKVQKYGLTSCKDHDSESSQPGGKYVHGYDLENESEQ